MEGLVIVSGIGLLLVFEGILPFLSPDKWRRLMQQMLLQSDQVLRTMGLVSMLIGLGLMWMVHRFF